MSTQIEAMRKANLEKYGLMSVEEKRARTKKATEANTGAKRSEESKEKMRQARKRYEETSKEESIKRYKKVSETMKSKSPEAKAIIKAKKSETMRKRWEELRNDPDRLAARNAKITQGLTGHKRSEASKRKQAESITGRKLSDDHKKKIAENSSGVVKSRFYEIAGIMCQGGSERMYIEYLLKNSMPLPTRPKSVKTPYGYYKPDFLHDGVYVEIKSSWTYKQMLKKTQLKKIQWVDWNVKPVSVIIVDSPDKIELTAGVQYVLKAA